MFGYSCYDTVTFCLSHFIFSAVLLSILQLSYWRRFVKSPRRIDSSWFKRIDCSSHVSFILIIPQWKNLNEYQRKPTALDIYINNWEYSSSYLSRTPSNFSKWIFARKTRRYIPRETPARSPSMSRAFNLSNLSAGNVRSLWWPRYLSSQILPLANDLVTPKICLLQILLSNVERILS